MPDNVLQSGDGHQGGRITLRSVLLGMAVAVGGTLMQVHWQIDSSALSGNLGGVIGVFPLLVLIFAVNLGVGRFLPRLRLTQAELVLVFIAGLVASPVPISLVEFGVATVTGPDYFVGGDPRAAEVVPHISEWLYPKDTGNAVTWFYEGLPEGGEVNWSVFVKPTIAWGGMLAMLFIGITCMLSIIRRRWVEQERLAYPQLAVPLLCMEAGTIPDRRSFFTRPAFLIGLVPGIGFSITAILHAWNPAFPDMTPHFHRGFWQHFIGDIAFNQSTFLVIGVSYFVPTSILLSIWSFYLATAWEAGILQRVGLEFPGAREHFIWAPVSASWQTFGAFTVFVLASLWAARSHLRDVLKKTLSKAPEIDDSRELIPYRAAVIGLGLCMIGYIVWLALTGMGWGPAVLFVLITYLIVYGLSRVVAQTGLISFSSPGMPHHVLLHGIGSANLTTSTVASTGIQFAWLGGMQGGFSSAVTHSCKLADRVRRRRRLLPVFILLVLLMCFAAATARTIANAYDIGALNFQAGIMGKSGAPQTIQIIHDHLTFPRQIDFRRFTYFGIGALIMGAMVVLRHRFLWWPFHPVGIAVASSWPIRGLWLGVFITWLAKTLILRFGGGGAFKRGIPFFAGLAVGYYVGEGMKGLMAFVM